MHSAGLAHATATPPAHAPSPTPAPAPSLATASFPMLLDRILDRRSLSLVDAQGIMEQVLDGGLGPERLAAFVTAIRAKPLDAAELAGFALAMRSRAHRLPTAPEAFARPLLGGGATPGAGSAGARQLVDTCGTGAARVKSFNVSTASAFVVAACGVPVAKHGNRSVTRPSGSADVLAAAGVRLELTPVQAAGLLAEHGIVFLHAPAFHPSMKHAAQVRQALGVRTVFNLLGPLANPAGATHQIVGVHDVGALRPMAEALALLGVRDAYVLHGEPGFDEASVSGHTHSVRVADGHVGAPVVYTPEELGLARHPIEAVAPVPAKEAATLLAAILGGVPGPRADMVALNAAFALHVAGRTATLAEGVRLARATLASGVAARLLETYAHASQHVRA